MELGLTLGEAPPPKPFSFSQQKRCSGNANNPNPLGLDFGICMSLGTREEAENELPNDGNRQECSSSSVAVAASDTPLQLELLPFSPLPRSSLCLPWHSEQGNSDGSNLYLDVNRAPSAEEQEDGSHSRPHSPSQLAMDMGGGAEMERASSRASDEDENGLTRKKLRLSREQSAFLEESFKEHSTLNPKQKLALAKQLNLRPRQVEVWFQNRRARTKLKQTEVDCEYLKRCCEKLTEENRRLQKELQELRALKTSHPFYMHLPATTLTMCPSCERVASANTTSTTNTATAATAVAAATAASDGNQNASTSLSTAPSRPRFFPFGPKQNQSSVG